MPNTFLTIAGCLLLSAGIYAQSRVSGTVIDKQSGKPIGSVTIQAEKQTTLSGSDGRFGLHAGSLPVSLFFSHIGYISETIQVNDTVVQVWLIPKEETLEGVTVSTGYQNLPKERATGSFERIDSALLNRTVSTGILERLEGVTSGLFVKKTATGNDYVIRGLSTFTSGITEPLVVVDNFPFEGRLENINPNDVENITVLKDAAATSIWGARAGNGVIVITTRKGKLEQPLKLQVTANITREQAPDMASTFPISAASFLETEDFLFTRNFYNAQLTNATTRPLQSPYVEALAQHRSGSITADRLQGIRDSLLTGHWLGDLEKYAWQPEQRQQYHLQASGGGKQITYLAGIGYDQNRDYQVGRSSRRISLQSQTGFRVSKSLQVDLSINQTFSMGNANHFETNQGFVPGGNRATYYPYARLADANGRPVALGRNYRTVYTDTTGAGRLLDWNYIPLADRELNDNSSRSYTGWYRIGIQQKIGGGITLQGIYQYQYTGSHSEALSAAESYAARNLVNLYSQRTGSGISRPLPQGGILDRSESGSQTHSGRLQLNYGGRQGGFEWNMLGGTEIRQTKGSGYASLLYGYNPDALSSANVDFVTIYPSWGNLRGNAQIPSSQGVSQTDNRFVSAFANGGVNYLGKYMLSLSARKDASNILGVSTNQKGVPLASAGLAWEMAKENWMQHSLFKQLKLRATYGGSGNVNPSLSSLATIRYTSANLNLNNVPGALVVNPPNPELRWEKVKMMNIGLDFALKNTGLSGSVEWYAKRCEDLLAPVLVDITSGFNALSMNSGVLKGSGWDIQLNYSLKLGKGIYQTNLLVSNVQNEVVDYYYSSGNYQGVVGSGQSIQPVAGYPVYGLFSYRWAGLDPLNGDPQGYINKDVSKDYSGLIRPTGLEELTFHGTTRPSWFGFWRHTFSFQGLSLSANIGGEFGHYFRKSSISYGALYNSWAGHADIDKRWRAPGDEANTNIPSMPFPLNNNRDNFYLGSEPLALKADHIRLQDIRISYNMGYGKTGKRALPIELFVYGNNLGLLWAANNEGIDPAYPNQATPRAAWSLGIRAAF